MYSHHFWFLLCYNTKPFFHCFLFKNFATDVLILFIILVSYLKSFFKNYERNRLQIPLNKKGAGSKYGGCIHRNRARLPRFKFYLLYSWAMWTLGKLLDNTVPSLSLNVDKNSYLTELFLALNNILKIVHLEQCLF